MTSPLRIAAAALTASAVVLLAAGVADADPLKCQRTVLKESAKYAQAKMKMLSKCEESVLKGKIGGPCPDAESTDKLTKAETKMKDKIAKACGGADKTCATLGDNDPLASIGWDVGSCPDLDAVGCNHPINHCGDIGDCLSCVIEQAVDQAIALSYGNLEPAMPGSDLSKCQVTIGKETAKFYKAKSKVLQKCEDALLKGKPGFSSPCPSGDASGKSEAKLAKAEAKMVDKICKKCGGADKLCDGVDDFGPAAIGFAAACPAVEVPGVENCGLLIGQVNSLASLVECLRCVISSRTGCLDLLGVPTLAAYPDDCSGSCTPPNGACPTSLQVDFVADGVDLDAGWTGLAHDAKMPTRARLTFDVSGCAGTEHPSCGQCTLSGPTANAGGTAFNNRRCTCDTAVRCTSNADCPGACPCRFFLGAPLPSSAGGVSVCTTNEIVAPVSGTIDIENHFTGAAIPVLARAYTGPTQDKPCPNCIAGACDSGLHAAGPCTINGRSQLFGEVSFDCPPDPGGLVGQLPVTLDLTTGTQTRTLSAASPACRAGGWTDGKCLCDTCATAAAEPCGSNADCPGGAICGGRRCTGGTNNGSACELNSECPGGVCAVSGEATRWNACEGQVCTPNPGDTDSTAEGVCASGPFEHFCAIDTFRGCVEDGDCPKAGDTCTFSEFRECFTDNGVIGARCFGGANGRRCLGGTNALEACSELGDCPDQGAGTACARVPCNDLTDCPDQGTSAFCGGGGVSVEGVAGTVCGLKADPTVVSYFCVPPTVSSAVNSVGGLPGLGRVTIPTVARFDP